MADRIIPISGRPLTPPDHPVFSVHRTDETVHEIGAFRGWAGYKTLGTEEATDDVALLQHVLSFSGSEQTGGTGLHCHLAHVQIVIPTSGRGVFTYDGVVTEAVPGVIIAQHGGTIHEQYEYSYAASSGEENRKTPLSVDPYPPGAPPRSFSFLELFVPPKVAHVEVMAAGTVSEADRAIAWEHPYHTPGSSFAVQQPDDPGAAYRPVRAWPGLEARDAHTWGPTGGLTATWVLRPAEGSGGPPLDLEIPGESGGIVILYMVEGHAKVARHGGETVLLNAGDTLTHSQGEAGTPFDLTPGARVLKFFISAKCYALRERTTEEIKALQSLGAGIVTHKEVRPPDDRRPVNCFQEPPPIPAMAARGAGR